MDASKNYILQSNRIYYHSKKWFICFEINMFTTPEFSETRPFMHLSKDVFQSQ